MRAPEASPLHLRACTGAGGNCLPPRCGALRGAAFPAGRSGWGLGWGAGGLGGREQLQVCAMSRLGVWCTACARAHTQNVATRREALAPWLAPEGRWRAWPATRTQRPAFVRLERSPGAKVLHLPPNFQDLWWALISPPSSGKEWFQSTDRL